MKLKSKTLLNLVASFSSQFVILALGLLVPRIIMTSYGSDVNGLTSTITQVFTYMSLLEAGISQATRNKLYKPIQEDDHKEISNWMAVSRHYYRNIAKIYFAAVVLLSFGLPLALKTQIEYQTAAIYIFFEGLTSVVSFYFLNTWITFLTAKGEMYFVNTISLLNRILCHGIKIILALKQYNIAVIQIGYFFVSIIQIIIYNSYMKRKYGWIDYSQPCRKIELPDRKSYIIVELTWTIFSSTDLILLSVFVTTTLSSVYAVYNLPFVALNGLLNAVYNALNYQLGQTYHKGIEEYSKKHDVFTSAFVGGMTMLMSVTYIMIIPFVRLYTYGVNDVEYIYPILPLLFCLVQLLSWSRYVSGNLIGISGRIKQAVKINIIEAATNLILSLLLVRKYELKGVLLATVLALPLKVIYCTYISDRVIMNRSCKNTIKILLSNYSVFAVIVLVNQFISIQVSNFGVFIVYAILYAIPIAILVFVVNILTNRELRKVFMMLINRRRSEI